jgi:hypothetical protein
MTGVWANLKSWPRQKEKVCGPMRTPFRRGTGAEENEISRFNQDNHLKVLNVGKKNTAQK